MDLKIDKSHWNPVKLGDVFTKKEENDKENARNRFDRFLKVNHMDSECLHVKRWASQENGEELNPYFYKIFRKGQILFPTRNPHLRRTVLAPFDGITGEKTLTLEPQKEFLDPNFISFIFHSESFYAHTTGAIIGSTNPHCRWRDVANFEFLLPPKNQQTKIAKLLWTIDEVIESEKELLEKIKINDLSHLKQYFFDDNTSEELKLKNIVSIKKGKQPSELLENESGVPYCKAKYLRSGVIEQSVPETSLIKSILINDDDIIILWDGAAGEIFKGRKGVLASTMSKIEIINNEFIKDYIFEFLRFRSSSINRASVGSVIKHVDPTYFNNISVPKFSLDKQNLIVNKFNSLRLNIEMCKSKIKTSKSLQKSLINQIF